MLQFLGCLFVFFIAIVLMVVMVAWSIIKSIFGIGGTKVTFNKYDTVYGSVSGNCNSCNIYDASTKNKNKNKKETKTPSPNKKIFSDDEGEYVDFKDN